jgi:hypothetical protein
MQYRRAGASWEDETDSRGNIQILRWLAAKYRYCAKDVRGIVQQRRYIEQFAFPRPRPAYVQAFSPKALRRSHTRHGKRKTFPSFSIWVRIFFFLLLGNMRRCPRREGHTRVRNPKRKPTQIQLPKMSLKYYTCLTLIRDLFTSIFFL